MTLQQFQCQREILPPTEFCQLRRVEAVTSCSGVSTS
jgi:hypothetical protein